MKEKILLDTMCKKIDDAIRGMGTNYDDNENGLKYKNQNWTIHICVIK